MIFANRLLFLLHDGNTHALNLFVLIKPQGGGEEVGKCGGTDVYHHLAEEDATNLGWRMCLCSISNFIRIKISHNTAIHPIYIIIHIPSTLENILSL